jgi:uncharacterized protein with von Willebrand factor type A (vWA) domain
MLQHSTSNFVYFLNKNKEDGKKSRDSRLKAKLQQILETLSKQAMKEKTPDLEELESALQNALSKEQDEKSHTSSEFEEQTYEGGQSITKFLQEKGYLRDNKKWLTHKGFFTIGWKILQDVTKDLSSSEFGMHETNFSGEGNVIIDTTKKFEKGNDIKFLCVPQTILNTIQRISKSDTKIDFPLNLHPEDLEEFETLEDVRVAVVYCIDLSSTMKFALGKNGKSRIEAAKKALWSLYLLNKKFFPNDSLSIVGFASMASIVDPFDIPFLKTYDANENFLHYTNYQAAFRLARKILQKTSAQNKRIVMITDGQPSACFVDNEYQKQEIISEKPYSNFYTPQKSVLSKIKDERNLKLNVSAGSMVYLCYRFKKVDPKINERTLVEAKKCKRDGIEIDTIVVSEEKELLKYAQDLEKELRGKTFHINQENMDKVLVTDYLSKTRKVLSSNQSW